MCIYVPHATLVVIIAIETYLNTYEEVASAVIATSTHLLNNTYMHAHSHMQHLHK